MAGAPFAVLYRWRVEPAHEAEFRERWRRATLDYREKHGAIGSCLARDERGDFVAFARWPSEQARAEAFAARGAPAPWPGIIKSEEMKLTVVDDLLTG